MNDDDDDDRLPQQVKIIRAMTVAFTPIICESYYHFLFAISPSISHLRTTLPQVAHRKSHRWLFINKAFYTNVQ